MIIVDSCVIIDYINGKENEKTIILKKLLNDKIEIGINSLIFFEIYLGNKPKKEKNRIDELLERFVRFDVSTKDIVNAIEIYNKCQEKGKTIKQMDIIIASNCIEYGFPILSNDNHFNIVSLVTKGNLKIYP